MRESVESDKQGENEDRTKAKQTEIDRRCSRQPRVMMGGKERREMREGVVG